MEAIAKVKHQRGSARKVRLVADLVRNKSVNEARNILTYSKRKAARMISKVLESAVANAANMAGKVEADKLYVSTITIDEGATMKRYRPRAHGRADVIRKRTSSISIAVSDNSTGKLKKEALRGSKN